jgi:hypothetical protein
MSFHPLNAAPMFGIGFQWDAVTEHLSEVKSFTLICYDDCYFVAGPAAAADVYFSLWILLIAMQDRIIQRLPEGQLDGGFRTRNASRSFNQPHQAIYQR